MAQGRAGKIAKDILSTLQNTGKLAEIEDERIVAQAAKYRHSVGLKQRIGTTSDGGKATYHNVPCSQLRFLFVARKPIARNIRRSKQNHRCFVPTCFMTVGGVTMTRENLVT
jgi:hypothetical protein